MEQIKEAVYLINDERYLHLRENGAGVGFATYNKVTGEPLESGQISEKNLPPDGRNAIPAARNWYLFELSDDDRKIIQQESVKILENIPQAGIGTPATRAATIEKLVQKGFLERKGNKKTKVLLPTDKGKALITVMPEEIQSPEMTADWETKLLRIERSEMEPGEFMTEINTMITELVKNTEMKKGVGVLMKNKIIGVCPNCGKPVVEREKGWFCENRECRFVLWKDNAFFKRLGKRLDAHVADKLLRDGRVRLKECRSAKGKTYNATVLLSCEADGRSKFSLEFEGGC